MENTLTCDGLCLRNMPYKDSDALITVYAAGRGKITAKVRGAKSAKSKLRYAASPMNFGRYIFAVKGDKATVTACDVYDTFFTLSSDPVKYYAGCTVCEFLDKTQPEGMYDNDLMTAALRALRDLSYSDNDADNILTDFLVQGLKLAGYERNGGSLRELGNYVYRKTDVILKSLQGYLAMR